MSNKLSNHVQNLLKAVKDNPLRYEELKSLYETDSPSPDYFQPQVLSAIFLPFHTSPPTSRPPLGHMPPQKDRLALLRGMSATQALQNILYHTEDGKTPPGFTLEVLADSHILPAWPAIFEWMKFLHYTTPYNISFDFSDIPFDPSARSLFNTHMLEAIITVIFLTRSPPNYEMNPLCTAVCRTRGVLPMALEIWIRQQELSSIDWRFSEALKSMMFFAGSPDVDELNRTGFKLGHANLASLLMRPLRFVTYSRPTDKRMQGFGATMQGYLAFSEPAPILFKALVDQGLMVDIMHGISSIMSLPAIPKVIGVTAMESAFILVHMSTFAMDANKKWLRAALRLKMIPLLAQFETTMKAAGTPAKTVASFTQRAFGDIFMPYIFHPGILLSLAEVMKSLSQDLPQAIKTLDGQWKAFSVGVDMVGKQVETFEKSGGFRLKCSLFRCNKRESDLRFNTCSACREVVYCSLSCQKQDWKERHRDFCRAHCSKRDAELRERQKWVPQHVEYCKIHCGGPLRDERNIDLFHVSLRHRAFLVFAAENYTRDMQSKIRSELRTFQRNTNIHGQIILSIEIIRMPMTHSLIRPEDLLLHLNKLDSVAEVPAPNGHISRRIIQLPPNADSRRRPLIQPCITVAFGIHRRLTLYIPSELFGDLYGWIGS